MTFSPTLAGVLLTAGGYLSGSILFSYELPLRLRGIDVTAAAPDHNPGVCNAFAAAGVPMGILCLLCELCKGAWPAALCLRLLGADSPWLAPVMAAPVLGHAYPLFRRRGGGKAIAVSFGVLLGLWPVWGPLWLLAGYYLLFSLVIVVSPHSVRTVLTFGLWLAGIPLVTPLVGVRVGALLCGGVVIWRHVRAADGAKASVRLFRRA